VWCDTFDGDLLKLVPGAAEVLGEAAGVQLTTYSRLTGGVINHPSVWNTHVGFASFFWTSPEGRPDETWSTDAPEADCTFLEAVRDMWVHSAAIIVNRSVVWRPPVRVFMRLLADARGQKVLPEADRERDRQLVVRGLEVAAATLRDVVSA
jgi:hypothetical protein